MHSSLSPMEVLWKLVLTVGLLGSLCEGSISCKNEGGSDVDWFILYKKNNGFEYVYTDSTDQNLKKGNKKVNDQDGVLANTLKPYFDKSTGSKYILYNDQPPTCESVSPKYGHSKGVVMMDTDTVVWLLHSTPNFPNDRIDNFYPKTGERNAQIFLCVTLNKNTEASKIEQHLKDINAFAFDKQNLEIPKSTSKLPFSEELQSKGGQTFQRFAKKTADTAEEGDLYVTIAETLQTDLYIQTWQSKDTDSHESKNYNLNTIKNIETSAGDWGSGNDHSKWCVSKDKEWTCVADSNRHLSQFERPGGALCIKKDAVADAFRELISDDGSRPPKKARPQS